MINQKYIRLYDNCIKYKPTEQQLASYRSDIEKTIPILKAIYHVFKNKGFNVSSNDIIGYLQQTFTKFDDNICQGYLSSYLYEKQTINYLLTHHDLIYTELPKAQVLQQNDSQFSIYTQNITANAKHVLVEALDLLNNINDINTKASQCGNGTLSLSSFLSSETVRSNKKVAKNLIKMANSIKNKPFFEQIVIVLENLSNDVDRQLISIITTSLSSLIQFFNTFGCTYSYLNQYLTSSKTFGFDELSFERTTSHFTKNDIGFEELFSPKYLETLDSNELCFLAIFWNNRLAKECTSFARGLLGIESLDLWDYVYEKNNDSNVKISTEKLISSYNLSDFVTKLHFNLCELSQQKRYEQESKPDFDIDKFNTENNQIANQNMASLSKYIFKSKKHSNFFTSDDSLFKYMALVSPIVNLESHAYYFKQDTLFPIINSCLDGRCKIKNWGLIRYETNKKDGELFDSINNGSSKALFAFDIPGFNFPFRFHVKSDTLQRITRLNKSSLFPEYQGYEDFNIDGKTVPANIIMPIPMRHRSIIRFKIAASTENSDFWEHLLFLATDKFPTHLMKIDPKTGKPTRFEKTYTDIVTGKRYILSAKDTYTEISDDIEPDL